jgi:MoaA/NifB/PqqE/SkfB family radical SAM enzyme
MQVKVNWDTDGYSLEELGLQEVVTIPTINIDEVADYLSDEYGYCVESFTIVDLDSGYYHDEVAWLLSDDGSDVAVLTGGHTLEEALEAKEYFDSDDMGSEYSDYIVWMSELKWMEHQDLSGEWAEQYEW